MVQAAGGLPSSCSQHWALSFRHSESKHIFHLWGPGCPGGWPHSPLPLYTELWLWASSAPWWWLGGPTAHPEVLLGEAS